MGGGTGAAGPATRACGKARAAGRPGPWPASRRRGAGAPRAAPAPVRERECVGGGACGLRGSAACLCALHEQQLTSTHNGRQAGRQAGTPGATPHAHARTQPLMRTHPSCTHARTHARTASPAAGFASPAQSPAPSHPAGRTGGAARQGGCGCVRACVRGVCACAECVRARSVHWGAVSHPLSFTAHMPCTRGESTHHDSINLLQRQTLAIRVEHGPHLTQVLLQSVSVLGGEQPATRVCVCVVVVGVGGLSGWVKGEAGW